MNASVALPVKKKKKKKEEFLWRLSCDELISRSIIFLFNKSHYPGESGGRSRTEPGRHGRDAGIHLDWDGSLS